MEDFHAVCHDGLQDGHAAGERREGRHEEEREPYEAAESVHRGEHFRQRDEHQTGAGLHSLNPLEHEDGRNDHHSCQQRDACVKKLNLVDGCVDIHVFFDVGAVRDHDPHRYAQREEDLAHGVEQDLQESPQCESLKAGHQVNAKPLQPRTRHARLIGVPERQRKDRDGYDHHQHDRHQDAGILFNALFDAVEDDPCGEQHEDRRKQGRLSR